jgi:hypothetical protein
MSDIDVLSHEYKTISDLAMSLNSAVTAAKRLRYKLPGSKSLTPENIRSYQEFLSAFLVSLSHLISATRVKEETRAGVKEPIIPGAFVGKVKVAKQTLLPHYLGDLKEVVKHLEDGFQCLTEEDIRLLDELCSMSDAETSSVFRRLWRK